MLEQKLPETKQPVVEQGILFDKAELERLKVERQHWEETTVRKAQERMPECDNLMTTSSVPINRIYTPQDNESLDYSRNIGLPGQYPFTRGVQPTMYRAKPWTMRMFAGYGTAEDTNKRFKYLLQQGQTVSLQHLICRRSTAMILIIPWQRANLANVVWLSPR